MDAEGLSVEREIQPIDPLLNKMQLKYQQQAADLELTSISTCIINQIRKHLFNSIRIIIPERSIRNWI